MLGDLSKEVVAGARVAEIVCRSECVSPCSWMKRSDAPCRSAWKPAQLWSQPWSSARPSYW